MDSWDAFPTEAPSIERPITRVTVTPRRDAKEPSWDDFTTEQPKDLAGIAKAGGIGVVKGGLSLAGMGGDVRELAAKGINAGSKLAGYEIPQETAEKVLKVLPGAGGPTTAQLREGLEKITGPLREPQNQIERDAETVGEFVPAALAGPGGMVRKLALQAALPAAANIVAGRYSDQNPYVKALAGFLAGTAGVVASGPSSVQQIVRSKLPASVTEHDITRAGQLIDHARGRSVALTWPEALSRVTGQPVLTDLQRVLESHPRTRSQLNEFFADRPASMENAARTEFDRLGSVHQNPSMLGSEAGEVAEGVLGRVRSAINQATRPHYDAARSSMVPDQVHAAMMADPLFEQALNAVRNDPARNAMIRGLSDRSTVVYDAVKQELAERARNAASTMNPNASQTVAAATGRMGNDVRDLAVASDRHAMGLAPGQGTGNLEHALAEQARLRQTYLEPLQRGPLGKIADKDPTTQRAIEALFPSNPVPHTEAEISTAIRAIANQRPAVAEQLVRAHAEMVFNEAMRSLQGGANHFAGAKFAKVIAGNPQQFANLRAAVEALPNGAARWQGFEHLLDIMSATGARQPRGSLTAFNALEVPAMTTGGLQELAAKGASPGKWMTLAHDTFKEWSLGRNLDGLARLITDPRAGNAINKIVRVPAGSDRGLMMVGRLIGQLSSTTTEQRTKPRQGNSH